MRREAIVAVCKMCLKAWDHSPRGTAKPETLPPGPNFITRILPRDAQAPERAPSAAILCCVNFIPICDPTEF